MVISASFSQLLVTGHIAMFLLHIPKPKKKQWANQINLIYIWTFLTQQESPKLSINSMNVMQFSQSLMVSDIQNALIVLCVSTRSGSPSPWTWTCPPCRPPEPSPPCLPARNPRWSAPRRWACEKIFVYKLKIFVWKLKIFDCLCWPVAAVAGGLEDAGQHRHGSEGVQLHALGFYWWLAPLSGRGRRHEYLRPEFF